MPLACPLCVCVYVCMHICTANVLSQMSHSEETAATRAKLVVEQTLAAGYQAWSADANKITH